MLCLHYHGAAIGINNAALTLGGLEEVAYIELQTGLGSKHLHEDACNLAVNGSRNLVQVATGVEHEVVVITLAVLELLVVLLDVLSHRLSGAEVEGCALNSHHCAVGHECRVDGSDAVGSNHHLLLQDVLAQVAAQVEI